MQSAVSSPPPIKNPGQAYDENSRQRLFLQNPKQQTQKQNNKFHKNRNADFWYRERCGCIIELIMWQFDRRKKLTSCGNYTWMPENTATDSISCFKKQRVYANEHLNEQ